MAEEKRFDPTKMLRDFRDASMDAWAKMMLRLTYSHEYQRMQGMISKPTLLGVALWRKASEQVMSGLLSQLNMPSREEVLQLSQRLTHVQMTLDDMAATIEQLRKSAPARSQRTAAASNGGGEQPRAPMSAKEA